MYMNITIAYFLIALLITVGYAVFNAKNMPEELSGSVPTTLLCVASSLLWPFTVIYALTDAITRLKKPTGGSRGI